MLLLPITAPSTKVTVPTLETAPGLGSRFVRVSEIASREVIANALPTYREDAREAASTRWRPCFAFVDEREALRL